MTVSRRQFGLLAGVATVAGLMPRMALGDDVARQLATIEAQVKGRLGVAIFDTDSGKSWTHRGGERFPMCSTFKVLACAAILARVDDGREHLNRRITFGHDGLVSYSPVTEKHVGREGMTLEAICRAAMTHSDNTAANIILSALGGPQAVTQFARSCGDKRTRLDRWETELNEALPGDVRDTTTPRAMAANLNALAQGNRLSAKSRKILLGWMMDNTTGDTRLRAGLPGGWRIGDKTGTGDRGTANDVAVIWPPKGGPVLAAVYMTGTTASTEARNAAIADVGRVIAAAIPFRG